MRFVSGIFAILLCLRANMVFADDAASQSPAIPTKHVYTAPKPVGPPHSAEQNYPDEARRLHEQGVVHVAFTIEADGTTSNLSVVESSGFRDLDDAAIKSVKTWRYLPATEDGRPIAVKADFHIGFTLSDTIDVPHEVANASSNITATLRVDANASAPDYTPPARDGSQDSEGDYPPEARARKEQGRAQIDFTVHKDGSVAEPSLTGSTGFSDLDIAAIQAIEARHYKPATSGGNPVEARWRDYVDFTLTGVAIPPGVIPPKPIGPHDVGSFYPASARFHHEQGVVLLIFTVQQDGSVSNPFVRQSSGFSDLDDAAIQIVKTWRYSPATKDGKPVAVQISTHIGFQLIDCDSLRC